MSKVVKEQMNGVRQHLINEYGEIKSEWTITLQILEDTLERYYQVKAKIKESGLINENSMFKNPLLATEKDCIATILKLSQKLGISPWDSSKIKNTENNEMTAEDFINALSE